MSSASPSGRLRGMAGGDGGAPVRPEVVELRRYRLHPGRRDDLIALFDRAFVESQEDCGMAIMGQFRDLDDPDRFVWLRGFADMATRDRGLRAFYGGPVWKANRDAANATMVDASDALLLRPETPGGGLTHDPGRRPRPGATPSEGRALFALIQPRQDLPLDVDALAVYVTEHAENTFPALPVRTDVDVRVTLTHTPAAAPEVLRLAPTPSSALR